MGKFGGNSFILGRKLPNASGPANIITMDIVITVKLSEFGQLLLLVSLGCSLYENIESLIVCPVLCNFQPAQNIVHLSVYVSYVLEVSYAVL